MKKPNSWTQKEIDVLKEHYPKGMSLEQLQKLLPDRTIRAIIVRVRKLKIKREEKSWSDKEVDLLRKYYPRCSSAQMREILPKRTIQAMHGKASILGITKESFWNKEEEQLFKKHYRSKISIEELKELFPNRSYSSILHKACKLGIKKGKYIPEKNSELSRRWTKDEVEFVKKFYDSMTDKELLELLPGRTISGLKGLLRTHKIPCQKSFKRPCSRLHPWSNQELDTLIKNYNRVTNEELQKLLPDRTWGGIKSRM